MFPKWSHFLFVLLLTMASNNTNGNFHSLLNGTQGNGSFNLSIIDPLIVTENELKMQHEDIGTANLFDSAQRIARKIVLTRKSAPTFLLNVYRNVLTKEGTILTQMYPLNLQNLSLRRKDMKLINRSDVIITFGGHNPFSVDGPIRNRGRRIWFDVSDVPKEERMIAAQFRMYRVPKIELRKGNVNQKIKSFTFEIYRIGKTKEGVRKKHFLDSTKISANYEGWLSLNISKALRYWLRHPRQNRGLFLRSNPSNRPNQTLRPDDIGIVGVLGIPDKQPFMIGFFESPATSLITNILPIASNVPPITVPLTVNRNFKKFRLPRSVQVKSQDTNPDNILNNRPVDSGILKNGRNCKVHKLYVNFRELNWDDWIIAPDGFEANFCNGECTFPLHAQMNATNHAVVQMLAHLKKPDEIPKPCCAPTKLSSINVIYFLDESNVVLKKYKNMAVSKCGCI